MGMSWVDAEPAQRLQPPAISMIAFVGTGVVAGLAVLLSLVPSQPAQAQGWLSDPPALTTVCRITSAWDADYPMTIGESQPIALGFCAGR